jgi:hypothetical protein
MNEMKKSSSPILYLAFTLLGMAVLNSALLILRAAMTSTTIIMVLYYACSLLSLFMTMIGIGAALFYVSRMMAGVGCRILLLTEGASLIPMLAAAVRTAFDYPDYFTDALVTEILSALGNTILMLGIHLLLLLLCWLLFFRNRQPVDMPQLLPKRNRLALSNLLVVAVLFLYQIIAETVETVNFLSTYWPNVYRNEIASIVFSYVYILLSLVLGYVIQYITQAFLCEVDQ